MSSGREKHLAAAGYWYEFVSLPIFRFILFRWYFRLFLWYQFLWRVRGLPLHLNLYHPDRAGGLGFLTGSIFAFAPILIAHTTFLAGVIGDRIWHAGATMLNFKMDILGSNRAPAAASAYALELFRGSPATHSANGMP